MKKLKTPQEKKRDSYSKDRRNAYGESRSRSRHSIRRRKRQSNRANRRNATTLLATSKGMADVEVDDGTQSKLEGKRPKHWQKDADVPLGSWVDGRLRRRAKLGIDDPASVEARVRRVRRNTGR